MACVASGQPTPDAGVPDAPDAGVVAPPDAGTVMEAAAPAPSAPEAFPQVRWGMSKAELREAFPLAMGVKVEVLALPSEAGSGQAVFIVQGGKVVGVGLLFAQPPGGQYSAQRLAPPAQLRTIEEAEAYAAARGVVLADKEENTGQIVAPRAFSYRAGPAVHVSITQFNSAKAAARWLKDMSALPFGIATSVQRGAIVFAVSGEGDREVQAVASALR
jgi:hypothetical protein